jgi:hypothetical protein
MTEDEEVAWINSLGFNVTVSDLRASYAQFQPTPIDPGTNVLWGTETDTLRNYFRLYQRTGYQGFLQQAKFWRDFFVNTYSVGTGGRNNIEYSHIYMMGLVDWYVIHRDQATLDAINRIIDFIKTVQKDFIETRAIARPLQCLCYYNEKIGFRKAECDAMIDQFLAGIDAAIKIKGFVTMKFMGAVPQLAVTGVPRGVDLRQLFPADASLFNGPNTYPIPRKQGCGLYQDCMLLHALRVTAVYRSDPSRADLATQIAAAYLPLIDVPDWGSASTMNLSCPYYLLPEAANLRAFISYEPNSPLYTTQYAAFCADPAKRRTLSQQALLRQYGMLSKIQPSEIGGKPALWPWETWQSGYFLLQH